MALRDPFTTSSLFERSLRGLLRPFLRALIAQGVTAPAFYRMVKQTYVEVAEADLGDAATDSRISVLTGVHRRDVKEFRNLAPEGDNGVGRKVSILSTVLGRWMAAEEFTLEDGTPAALPRTSSDGPSFEALVQSVSRDIRPRTVLDEFLRQSVVELEDDSVRLLLDGLVGAGDPDQQLHFFALNLGDHMNASVDNLLQDEPPHLERAVFYNNLTADSVQEVEAEARRLSADALHDLNALAAKRQQADMSDPKATHRFRYGVFLYKEDQSEED